LSSLQSSWLVIRRRRDSEEHPIAAVRRRTRFTVHRLPFTIKAACHVTAFAIASYRLSNEFIAREPMLTPDDFDKRSAGHLPGHLGIVVTHVGSAELRAEFDIKNFHIAPNGFLHAGSVVTLADTASGYGCIANLPEGATGFTTIELKSNHLGTARQGIVQCVATAVHLGRTTQVWDAVVTSKESGRTIALFRCTQMILYAQG
jgi:uncharacterized protein (TIGR00369 family)